MPPVAPKRVSNDGLMCALPDCTWHWLLAEHVWRLRASLLM